MPQPNVGYLIPEFPGQTHVYMWREITLLRKWKMPIRIFSTRRPDAATRARHAFTDSAEKETTYLWPLKPAGTFLALLWASLFHPVGFIRCIWLGMTLPVNKRPAIRTVLPMIVPACVLAKEASRTGVTYFHAHSCSNSAILCMMVKRLTGIPFALTLNANVEWWGGAMKEKFQDAEFTYTHANWLCDQVRREFPGLRADQTVPGRIGVDTRRWVPESTNGTLRAATGRLITVGRLHSSKGHDVLLRAVKLLADEEMDVTLRIAGGGPEREALEKLVAELGLGARVAFLGSISEDRIIEELRSSDLFVLASHAEPLGVVYMEAMALGIAAIGTAAGGVGEIITSGEDGILVPPHNPPELANAIKKLLADDELRHRLAVAGRESVVRKFDSRIGARVFVSEDSRVVAG